MQVRLITEIGYKRVYLVDDIYYVCNGYIDIDRYKNEIINNNVLFKSRKIQDVYDYFYNN